MYRSGVLSSRFHQQKCSSQKDSAGLLWKAAVWRLLLLLIISYMICGSLSHNLGCSVMLNHMQRGVHPPSFTPCIVRVWMDQAHLCTMLFGGGGLLSRVCDKDVGHALGTGVYVVPFHFVTGLWNYPRHLQEIRASVQWEKYITCSSAVNSSLLAFMVQNQY